MGNSFAKVLDANMHTALGSIVADCGCSEAFGFDNSVKAIMRMEGIEPWSAKDLVKANLDKQVELASVSPLKYIHVNEGLRLFNQQISSFDGQLSKTAFLHACKEMLRQKHIDGVGGLADDAVLLQVFDSLDYDRDEKLSRGEWAAGLAIYFKTSEDESLLHWFRSKSPCQAETMRAVFQLLDSDGNGFLSHSEMREYLTPYVKAMTPPHAAALRPLLLKKTTDDIFREMDLSLDDNVSYDEMLRWLEAGNNVVDKLVKLIEEEVMQMWWRMQGGQSAVGGSAYGGKTTGTW